MVAAGGPRYEIGKSYAIEGKVVPCKNGFHFCRKIEDLNNYYSIADSRIFEIEVYGDIKRDGLKYATKEIRIIKEVTKEEVNNYFKVKQQLLIRDTNPNVRRAVAEQGYGLDVLIQDKDYGVRCAVARQGYGPDTLIYDDNCYIRCTVAVQGYGLDTLISDRDPYVRSMVARQGYGMELLIQDEDWSVRRTVAEQGYGLDRLIHDEHFGVRIAVAKQGYGLDILVHDENWSVRETAKAVLESIVQKKNFS